MRIVLVAALFVATLFGVGVQQAHAQADTTPPELVSLVIEPTTVDTTLSSQTITLTATVRDDISGLDYLYITFGPEFGAGDFLSVTYGPLWENIVEGNGLEGTYVSTITLPQGTRKGAWVVKQFTLLDKAENKEEYFGSYSLFPEWLKAFRINVEAQAAPKPFSLFQPLVFGD